ncbi:MAG: UvrD-helicase domain-containing protein [Chitinivibrionia bacterium]|nr:UvrD-helicase domain-containing protein [Chitinivibrionia bacterium]
MNLFNVRELPLNKKVLIEASAGTGKTYNIGLIVLRLLLEKNLTIEKIVLITFTEAATAELKKNTAERIKKAYKIWKEDGGDGDKEKDLIEIVKSAKFTKDGEIQKNAQEKEVNLLDALTRIDEMPVFTIHGFCNKLLSEFPYETKNFEKRELITDTNSIRNRIVADFWRENIQDLDVDIELSPRNLLNVVNLILKHPHAKIDGEEYEQSLTEYKNADEKDKKNAARKLKYAIAKNLAKEASQRAEAEKKKMKIMDYDDMIKDCEKAVINDMANGKKLQNAIRNRYEAIFVDEFQDTDKMQFRIFDYLFEDKPFFMIGDPKQAIYRFRGGDIVAYKNAKDCAGEENRFSMNINFRTEQTLLEGLRQFFAYRNCFDKEIFRSKMGEDIDYTEVRCGKTELNPLQEIDEKRPPFVIWKGGDNENKPVFEQKAQKAVVSEVCRLLSTGKFEPKNIAILLDTNEDCLTYKNALVKKGVYAIVKGGSVFESGAAKFLRILLNTICGNNNIRYIRALLLHKFCGFEPSDIQGKKGDEIFNEWASEIFEAKAKWEKFGVMSAVDFFMENRKLWGNIAAQITGEREITNIRQILEILNEEEIKFGKIPEKINNRFAALLKEYQKNEAIEEKLESDDDALKIMTIHKSKGLEFDVVFVPEIGRSPRKHEFPSAYEYNEGSEKNIAFFAEDKDNIMGTLSNKEENEETARLLYVALTRAKYRLYLCFSPPKRTKDRVISKQIGASSVCREIFDGFSWQSDNVKIEDLENVLEEMGEFYNKKNTKIENFERKSEKFDKIKDRAKPTWTRTSFSKITKNLSPIEYRSDPKNEKPKIPAGARMGTLLHDIFENIDFKAKNDEIQKTVKEKLGDFPEFEEKDGNENENIAEVKAWVSAALDKTLPHSAAGKLKDVEHKIAELSFLMDCQKIDLKKIQEEIAKGKINFVVPRELPDKYISGAIDLIFLGADGKYYILDWKSNAMNGDFSEENVNAEMLSHGYHLQYYIYAVALKRWLEKTKSDFDFAQNFGGVYYIFIRGVNEKNADGIYFADGKKIANSIDLLDKSLKGEV